MEADHVHVIPASENLKIEERSLALRAVRPAGAGVHNMAIDDFSCGRLRRILPGNRAFRASISLSARAASDGTVGPALGHQGRGGITFAQEPNSAKFDGMPSSAIAAGGVDLGLSPEAVAKQLVTLADHPYLSWPPSP